MFFCCVAAQRSSHHWSGAEMENTAILMAGGVWTMSFGGHVILQDLKHPSAILVQDEEVCKLQICLAFLKRAMVENILSL